MEAWESRWCHKRSSFWEAVRLVLDGRSTFDSEANAVRLAWVRTEVSWVPREEVRLVGEESMGRTGSRLRVA